VEADSGQDKAAGTSFPFKIEVVAPPGWRPSPAAIRSLVQLLRERVLRERQEPPDPPPPAEPPPDSTT
jgi:hypothetical protein